MKLELILRLLDNDELSPEQVNDVKDFLEDYVERNQVCGALHFTFVSSASLKKPIYGILDHAYVCTSHYLYQTFF